jgi:hypothetical protein
VLDSVRALEGVAVVRLSHAEGRLDIGYDASLVSPERLLFAVHAIEPSAHPWPCMQGRAMRAGGTPAAEPRAGCGEGESMAKHETRTIALGSLISFGLPFGLLLAKSVELDSNLILCGTVAALIFSFCSPPGSARSS